MVLKIDKDYKVFSILNKDASANRPIITDPWSLQDRILMLNINSDLIFQPLRVFRWYVLRLLVFAIHFSENLNDFFLDLEFGFFSHEGSKWSQFEISQSLQLVVNDIIQI